MWDNLYVISAAAVFLLTCIIAMIWMFRPHDPVSSKPRRFCPLCKTELADNETLKGLIVDSKPPQKILIRGCTRCAPKEEQGQW